MADSVANAKDRITAASEGLTTAFAKRNEYLAAIVPDSLENAVDAIMPDALERVLDRGASKVALKYQQVTTDFNQAYGEVAAVLFRVAKYAYEKFHLRDIIFGVYHLAEHHAATNAVDAVEGKHVNDPKLVHHLLEVTDMATWTYCPSKKELSEASGIPEEDIVIMEPTADTNRPAYAVALDHKGKRVVWGFRGTTDLDDMLTDACASCVPYSGGYAHWGMLQAARWFLTKQLDDVVAICKEHPGYQLLLVGHSLGAGTATLLGHILRNDPEACAKVKGIDIYAVGVATPAVLTAELAESCSDYVTSVVLMHDVVPRFSIHNVFKMKDEMDATNWGDKLADTAIDWMIPDVIEKSRTYRKMKIIGKLNKRRFVRKHEEQIITFSETVSAYFLKIVSFFVSILHFLGLVKPNTEVAASQGPMAELSSSVRAGVALCRASLRKNIQAGLDSGKAGVSAAEDGTHRGWFAGSSAEKVQEAAQKVQDKIEHIKQEDVQAVYAPGKLYFIKRTDPPKEEGKEADPDAAAAPQKAAEKGEKLEEMEQSQEPYPGATFELIEGAKEQRFKRIVLRETCLMDHLCGGYLQGLRYTLNNLGGSCSK